MSTTNEIMELASEWAQETKDFGHLDESQPRDALLKAVEALAADAARYRWLREQARLGTFGGVVTDAAIDAAMKGETT